MTKLQRKTTREKIIDAVTEMEAEAIRVINLERRLGRLDICSREYDAANASRMRAEFAFRDKYGVAAMDVYNQVQMRKGKRDFRAAKPNGVIISQMNSLTDKTEDSETETYRPMRQTVYNRYQACCIVCGSLSFFQKKKDAINCAESHSCKKTSVADLMAHKDKEPIVWERAPRRGIPARENNSKKI